MLHKLAALFGDQIEGSVHRIRILSLLLVLSAVVAYLPAINSGFVWDDDLLLTANPQLQSVQGLKNIWLGNSSCEYTPLTLTTFWLEKRLWNEASTGYHVVSIFLHAIAAIFLWRSLSILRIPGSWLAAVLFVIHPINVASVAWIAELKNTLSGALFFASIFAFLASLKRRNGRLHFLSILLFALAGLSKGSVVTLPIVLGGCILWMNGKFKRRDAFQILPFLAIALVVSFLTIRYQSHAADYHLATSSVPFRIARAGTLIWLYLREILFPIGLSPMLPQWQPSLGSARTYLPMLLVVALSAAFFWKRKAWGGPYLFASAYYLWMLLPVLGIVWMTLQQEASCADWWQYLAAPGIFAGLAAGAVVTLSSVTRKTRLCLRGSICLIFVLLLVPTWRRSATYESMETYCRAVVAENPHSWTMQNNLGVELEHRGKSEQAFACYRQALRDNPRFMEAHNNLGNALTTTGRLAEAEIEFQSALQLSPGNALVLDNLADNYFRQGRIGESFAATAEAIKADRYNAHRYIEFGLKLAANKQFEQARVCFKNASLLTASRH